MKQIISHSYRQCSFSKTNLPLRETRFGMCLTETSEPDGASSRNFSAEKYLCSGEYMPKKSFAPYSSLHSANR